MDKAKEKRVELHLHTSYSTLDALTNAKAAVKLAAKWGHPAVAITDHGVVQAFPEACRRADTLRKESDSRLAIVIFCRSYKYQV